MADRRTRSDVVAYGVVGLLAGALVLPLLAQEDRARELANRSACAANLRGVMQSMVVYAADNNDAFPSLGANSLTTYDPATKGESTEGKSADDAIDALYKAGGYPNNPAAQLWLLVLKGQVAPRGFLCKSDPFGKNATSLMDGAKFRTNFDAPSALSYSIAFAWGAKDGKGNIRPGPWFDNTTDSSLPMLSDVAPFLSAKVAANERLTRPVSTQPAGTRPTDPLVLGGNVDDAGGDLLANSPNHQFQGQNVAFADGHVEFTRRPDVGQNNDNIWTETIDGKEVPIDAGALPGPIAAQKGPFDIVMIPTRGPKGDLK